MSNKGLKMPKVTIINRDKVSSSIELQSGQSLMEGLRAAGYDEIIAICGGNCSCATCHIYLQPVDPSVLPKISEDEEALLESLQYVTPESRLSCQIPINSALEGAVISIADEE